MECLAHSYHMHSQFGQSHVLPSPICYFFFKSCWHSVFTLLYVSQKLKEVLDFLKVPQRNLESRQVKIHTRPLFDHVKNWDEVSKVLNGTKYEHLLHSDQQSSNSVHNPFDSFLSYKPAPASSPQSPFFFLFFFFVFFVTFENLGCSKGYGLFYFILFLKHPPLSFYLSPTFS